MISKTQLRKEISSKRKALEPDWLAENSRRVMDNLLLHPAFQSAKMVALYKAIAGEVQLEPLFSACWSLGKQVCIPVYSETMEAYAMSLITPETRYTEGFYGIQEPASVILTDIDEIDLMVVPGVAFDLRGNRLGRGGGYYDRLLLAYSGKTIAVAFDFQVVEQIPAEPHDQPVHALATETTTVQVQYTD